MKSYKNENTAKRGMKAGDEIVNANDGGVFILRTDPTKPTSKYRLIGPAEEKTFGNKSNPTWVKLVK